MRRLCLVATAVALAALAAWGCSDDDNPPATYDGLPTTDGGDGGPTGDGALLDKGPTGDGFTCPMEGPCVLGKIGEGKHPGKTYLVIGEILTLTGTDLDTITSVSVGAADAPLISVTPTKVTCRIGPRTPPGTHTVEVQATDKRRMAGVIEVQRLVSAVAEDDSKLVTFLSVNHSAGAEIDLGEVPDLRPANDPTGRYVVSPGKTKLVVVDLAQEQAATVSGLTEAVTTWAVDERGETLVVSTSGGKLLAVDLKAFPTLTAKAVTGAPGTAAVVLAAPGLFAGVNPTASGSEGSLWYAATDLKAFSWAQQAGSPFVIGTGSGLQGVASDGRDGFLAMLVLDGPSMRFTVAQESSGALTNPAAPAVAGGLYVTVAQGGGYVALSSDEMTPTLRYIAAATPTTVSTVALGSGSASRLIAGVLPTQKNLVWTLVGPAPMPADPFDAQSIELADLAKGARLTLGGGKPAVELAAMRDVVADPIADRLHVITATHFHTFDFTLSGTTLTVNELPPSQQLPAGKKHRWITIQP